MVCVELKLLLFHMDWTSFTRVSMYISIFHPKCCSDSAVVGCCIVVTKHNENPDSHSDSFWLSTAK